MNKRTYTKISIATASIILTFAASNEHIELTYLIFIYIENILGLSGIFVFFGITAALLYLGIAIIVLRSDLTDHIKDALKVALVSYILILVIWGYLFFIFKPE